MTHMTIHNRIALGTAIAALSLGLTLAPAAFAQDKIGNDNMVKKDTMSKDMMMKKDTMSKGTMKKGDSMKKDSMKKDDMAK